MSILPTGQSLDQALPDLDELLQDPEGYLRAAPLAIGPPPVGLLAATLAVGGGLLLGASRAGHMSPFWFWGAIVLLLAAVACLVWSLRLRGYEMVLHVSGVELVEGETSIWAPWGLFHVRGRAVVSDSGRLVLPINAALVDQIELRRGGTVMARGKEAISRQWRTIGPDEARLAAPYEIISQDIAELLLFLGSRLGQAPLKTSPSAPLDPNGWYVVPLAHLRLPPCCASCGGSRDDVVRVRVLARGDSLLGPLVAHMRSELAIPICTACKTRLERRQRWGGLIGLASGAVLGALTGGIIGGLIGEGTRLYLAVGTLIGLFVGMVMGTLAGLGLSRKLPIQLRRYSPSRGVVSVRFQSPIIAAQVLERLRQLPDDGAQE